MRALRAPVIETHEILFFVLAGVVHAELRQGGSLVWTEHGRPGSASGKTNWCSSFPWTRLT